MCHDRDVFLCTPQIELLPSKFLSKWKRNKKDSENDLDASCNNREINAHDVLEVSVVLQPRLRSQDS